ncbi:MAG TPA: tetratricopeptide repeat protein [Candidatus Udaeobacter sp.]|nr:tetratricopeptide repeat protein [Candidatus Udaeobacter sp.]
MRSALLPKNNAPDASAEAALNLGLEHLRRNHLSLAAEALREALRRSPDHPLTLSYYGLCLARLETNYAEALRLCKRAAHLDPYDPALLVNMGKVYRLIGDRGAAYRSLRAAWALDRRHHPTMLELARMGMRRRPVLPWLHRNHVLNVFLGKLRARITRAFHSPPSATPH